MEEDMFQIHTIGNGLGDCFLIEIGEEKYPIYILVDGRKACQANANIEEISKLMKSGRVLDYLIVTHCDNDHIGGIIEIINQGKLINSNTNIIYNLVTKPVQADISYAQAEMLEKLATEYTLINTCSKDYSRLAGKLLLLSRGKRADFNPQICEGNKPILTLLSPSSSGINDVYLNYLEAKKDKNRKDSEVINRNSITFLLEYENKKAIFTGDAYFCDVEPVLNSLKNFTSSTKIDFIKLPHHGALNNCGSIIGFAVQHQCEKLLVTGETMWKRRIDAKTGKIIEPKHPAPMVLKDIVEKYINVSKTVKLYTNIIFDFRDYTYLDAIKNVVDTDTLIEL